MFLGLDWYWWLLALVAFVLSIPLKIKFMKWWERRRQDKTADVTDKWGDEQ